MNSGFMVAQYTAAALVTENRLRSFPASVESVPTSAGMEDHVSMGTHAAHKLSAVVRNTRDVLAIEALCAAQGLDLLDAAVAPPLEEARRIVREHSAVLERRLLAGMPRTPPTTWRPRRPPSRPTAPASPRGRR